MTPRKGVFLYLAFCFIMCIVMIHVNKKNMSKLKKLRRQFLVNICIGSIMILLCLICCYVWMSMGTGVDTTNRGFAFVLHMCVFSQIMFLMIFFSSLKGEPTLSLRERTLIFFVSMLFPLGHYMLKDIHTDILWLIPFLSISFLTFCLGSVVEMIYIVRFCKEGWKKEIPPIYKDLDLCRDKQSTLERFSFVQNPEMYDYIFDLVRRDLGFNGKTIEELQKSIAQRIRDLEIKKTSYQELDGIDVWKFLFKGEYRLKT